VTTTPALPDPRRPFAALLADETRLDLAEAALLVARDEYPELEPAPYLALLDAWAGRVRERLPVHAGPAAAAAALRAVLFDEKGLRGNADDYYDPRNSFLNDVLDRRSGIPISLSAVYLAVGRRAGLVVEGLGLPGHFIVRVGGTPGVLLDPFFGGTELSEEQCQDRLDRVFGRKARVDAAMLAPCDTRAILARMLRNLKIIYGKRDDHLRAVRVCDRLLELDPEQAAERRDRGLLYAGLGCYGLAADDLEAYARRAPRAEDAAEVILRAAELRRLAARLN
jgi:regulator of sirC expression with transglutaminase-like and TPR domain